MDVLAEKSVFEEAEGCIIFTGMGLKDFDQSQYEALLKEKAGDIEVSFMDGQQRIYDLIIGVL